MIFAVGCSVESRLANHGGIAGYKAYVANAEKVSATYNTAKRRNRWSANFHSHAATMKAAKKCVMYTKKAA